LDDAELKISCT